jgi:hypothetical protein
MNAIFDRYFDIYYAKKLNHDNIYPNLTLTIDGFNVITSFIDKDQKIHRCLRYRHFWQISSYLKIQIGLDEIETLGYIIRPDNKFIMLSDRGHDFLTNRLLYYILL